jgi:lipopolysaccharide export system permease protein
MNSDSELVVVEAAGVPPTTVLKPVLALSAAISMMVLVVSNFVEPWANSKLYDVIAQAQSDLFSVAVRSGALHEARGRPVRPGQREAARRRTRRDLSFRHPHRGQRNHLLRTQRSHPEIRRDETNILYLVDGELQQQDLTNNQISIVTFSSYALDMAAFVPAGKAPPPSGRRSNRLSYLLDPDPNDTTTQNRKT